jgi:hypothetical protein
MQTPTQNPPIVTRTAARRRWGVRLALVMAVVVVAAGCNGTWGIRQSYRNYITSPIANGQITTSTDVKWLDGPGSGKGPFQWPVESSSYDPATKKGTVQFAGDVSTVGHQTPAGYVLDTTFSRPRLVINGNKATISFDLTYRPFTGTSPAQLPAMKTAKNIAFAKLDLTGQNLVADANGNYTITNAPATGVKATMVKIGWDQFYGDPVPLDAFSATFTG